MSRRVEVGAANDPAEREADLAAEQACAEGSRSVMRGGKVTTGDGGTPADQPGALRMKANSAAQGGIAAPTSVESKINSKRGKGGALPKPLQQKLSHTFGTDFSDVKVHTDSTSHGMNAELGAKAFTQGSDMFFGKGQYAPGTPEGDRLIAHEAAHVVQDHFSISPAKVRKKEDVVNADLPADPRSTSSEIERVTSPMGESGSKLIEVKPKILAKGEYGMIKQDRVGLHYTGEAGKHQNEVGAIKANDNYAYNEAGPKGDLPLGTRVKVLYINPENWLYVSALTENGLQYGWIDYRYATKHPVTWEYTGNYISGGMVRSTNATNFAFVEYPEIQRGRMILVEKVQRMQVSRSEGFKEDGEVTDGRYWFTKVYSFVTKREMEIMENKNLYYPSLNMLAVLLFDKLYEDNLKRFDRTASHLMTDAHWKAAFENIKANDDKSSAWWRSLPLGPLGILASIIGMPMLMAIKSLVQGMIAHIRFDLPRAMNYAFAEHVAWQNSLRFSADKFKFFEGHPKYRQPVLNDYLPDFMASTYVFEMAMQDMIKEMNKHFVVPADKFPPWMMDIAMDKIFDADMNSERADTWRRAAALSKEKIDSPYTYSKEKGFEGDVTAKDHTTALKGLTDGLRPDMEASRAFPDKTALINVLRTAQLEKVASYSTDYRIRALRELTTLDILTIIGVEQALTTPKEMLDTKNAIIKILQASQKRGDLVTTVNGAGYWFLVDALGKGNTRIAHLYGSELPKTSGLLFCRRSDQSGQADGGRTYGQFHPHPTP